MRIAEIKDVLRSSLRKRGVSQTACICEAEVIGSARLWRDAESMSPQKRGCARFSARIPLARLSQPIRVGRRQLSPQLRHSVGDRIRLDPHIRVFRRNALTQKKRPCGAAPRPESLFLLAGDEESAV
jgi:hypothetical protein